MAFERIYVMKAVKKLEDWKLTFGYEMDYEKDFGRLFIVDTRIKEKLNKTYVFEFDYETFVDLKIEKDEGYFADLFRKVISSERKFEFKGLSFEYKKGVWKCV